MSRKLLLLCTVLFIASGSMLAQLPYSKMLNLTKEELKEKKFKYVADKNCYTMSKSNKTNKTMNILNNINGAYADVKPHQEDYTVTIQKGAGDKTAYLSVQFYNDDAYHNLAIWMAENNIIPIETNSGKLDIQKFRYEDYDVELVTELVSIKTTTTNTRAAAKSFDESYNVYTCTIFTGIAPESKWHTKEAEKKAKKKLKGDKEDINDLM